MEKNLILLAGCPGTGKSYLCDMIMKQYSSFAKISPDDMKEMFWDQYGYNNVDEKNQLIEKSWDYYYQKMDQYMMTSTNVISDYPFSNKQKQRLQAMVEKYSYMVITIRLIADLDVLFERQKSRDLHASRHLGHISSTYHVGDIPTDRSQADELVDYDEFMNRCKNRGYNTFQLGKLLELDVSDFAVIDYGDIMKRLEVLLRIG